MPMQVRPDTVARQGDRAAAVHQGGAPVLRPPARLQRLRGRGRRRQREQDQEGLLHPGLQDPLRVALADTAETQLL